MTDKRCVSRGSSYWEYGERWWHYGSVWVRAMCIGHLVSLSVGTLGNGWRH